MTVAYKKISKSAIEFLNLDIEDQAQRCIDCLKKDPGFMKPGRRNDDTVDIMIASAVLEIPIEEVGCLFSSPEDEEAFKEVFDRVKPYLDDWMSNGKEYTISKMIRYY